MEQTTIKVADFYGNPSYYSVMPRPIFDALEQAYLEGKTTVSVAKADFDTMQVDYKAKMGA